MKNMMTVFILSFLVAFSVFAEELYEISSKTSLTLTRDQSVEFKMVAVNDDTRYTLLFYGQLNGAECIEDNRRMALTLQHRSNPNDKTYDFLPKMKLAFYDANQKLIAMKNQCSLPFKDRHKYSVTFYPPYGGKFMKLLIQAGGNTTSFKLDGMKFGKARDQGAINVNPVTDDSGLYDYSAWDRFASGASMIVNKNGKVGFNSAYGSTGIRFPLKPNTVYIANSSGESLGYAPTVLLRILDKNNDQIEETRIYATKESVKFTTPPNCTGAVIHVRSVILDQVRVQVEDTNVDDSEDHLGEIVTIPAGSFLMGSSYWDGFGGPEESPQHRVYLPTYQIGKYEVTRGEYRRFIEAGGYDDPNYWSGEGWKWKESDFIVYAGMNGKFRKVVRPNKEEKRSQPEHWEAEQEWIGHGYKHPVFIQTDQHPVVGVTYYEAEAYCKWAGGRLPTEAEWEKAASWDEQKKHANTWPWGDTWEPEYCNNPEDHNSAGGGYKVNQSAPVGSYPQGASPYGCMDMVGNAYEWVAGTAKSYPGNPEPFDHKGYHFVRGGCWDDGPSSVRCAYRGWYLPPNSGGVGPGDSDYIGFRVAR